MCSDQVTYQWNDKNNTCIWYLFWPAFEKYSRTTPDACPSSSPVFMGFQSFGSQLL